MELNTIKKYEGKRVYMMLKNNFEYVIELPKHISQEFDIIDKEGKEVSINCDFIAFIKER